ncbi:MAG: NAD(P)-dependent oxidoreductase [Betaproteobacteria bacterium]
MALVVITGARGFIGKHLALYLSRCGDHVVGVGHGAWVESEALVWGVSHWINGDIHSSNLQSLLKCVGTPDSIFHLAGGSSVGTAISSPHEDFVRSVATTAQLLDWIRLESPATRLVAVSSAAVYGSGHLGGIAEDLAKEPFSPYGYHKLMMEQLCRSYAATYGTRVVVARLFSVYGSYLQKQLLWDLCTKLAGGASTIELGGNGEELRDWTDVRDVVRALNLLKELASDTVPTINVGTGKSTSVCEVGKIVKNAWPIVANIVFNGKSRVGDPFSLVADNSRLRALGFEWEFPVETGVCDYVEWYLRQASTIT